MVLSDYVNTFGQYLLRRYGERIHKLTINASFTCPNRDGTKGRGGCTFCNNVSFNPNARHPPSIASQLDSGRQVIAKRTGARRFLAYFQAYTNTYADLQYLSTLYEQALAEPDVVGLSIGTRPDCLSDEVLDLLAGYQKQGYEIWLELGLQSAFDDTLERIQRGHDFASYQQAVQATRQRGIPICTHLIIGLPGEERWHNLTTLDRVLALGVEGLKLHPLHVVKHTILAKQWREGSYQPLDFSSYVSIAADMIERTPPEIIYHRVTATAQRDILLTPKWCHQKWAVLNAITSELHRRNSQQGAPFKSIFHAKVSLRETLA
ncbi:MAG: TIGR01212 family radical SAM protein [Candidatus Parabeggiatoa sp. nov. 3]|nr:MAG: TIGR01212 family radical SAM protein [Gammaproteobacteria bacterium]RKZ68071.1 MAG: TIGR01212 family radical SAM protein [Gammaproteobacteria bacterium]RKZ88410.1 MAG: TIGR01212 family radical SAM protein [Gammaproteobacteria bacterium]